MCTERERDVYIYIHYIYCALHCVALRCVTLDGTTHTYVIKLIIVTCWTIHGLFLQFSKTESRFKAQSRLACIELAGLFTHGFVSKWAFTRYPQNGDTHGEKLINGSLV